MESLHLVAASVTTPSTEERVRIFRDQIPSIISRSDMSAEFISLSVNVMFQTMTLYDDYGSKRAVDNVVIKALREAGNFMKIFEDELLKRMNEQAKLQSHVGILRLLKWSRILLREIHLAQNSTKAFGNLAAAQASLLHIVMQRSHRAIRACKKHFHSFFDKFPEIVNIYMEQINDAMIPCKDNPELWWFLVDYTSKLSESSEDLKLIFLEKYVDMVLNGRVKQCKGISEPCPLLKLITHEYMEYKVVPLLVKMLKRSPETVLESVGILLNSLTLDLSKYAIRILSVVLPHARHSEEGRRNVALTLLRCLASKSSKADILKAMVDTVIGEFKDAKVTRNSDQKIGMINSLQELSHAPILEFLNNLAMDACNFLLSRYNVEGNEGVKLAILSAIASWSSKYPKSLQQDLLIFFRSGLREQFILRRGHLHSLWVIIQTKDARLQMLPLIKPLLQFVRECFTKAAYRQDGIYALLIVAEMAAADNEAGKSMAKEKILSLISEKEPSVVPLDMVSKLSVEDGIACVDLLKVLIVKHKTRSLELLSKEKMMQLLLHLLLLLMCSPSLRVHETVCHAAKQIVAADHQLSECLWLIFFEFLSGLHKKVLTLKTWRADKSLNARPPADFLFKILRVISFATDEEVRSSSVLMILCSHHPCIVGTAKPDAVWKRLRKFLCLKDLDVSYILTADVGNIGMGLLRSRGLMSANPFEHYAALHSLKTLMSVAPADTYKVFQEYCTELPDCRSHDTLSEKEIQIFRTPEGTLSTEQGVYVAKVAKSTREAKDHNSSNSSIKRRQSGKEAGEKDSGKVGSKVVDKGKTPKKDPREMLLREEASIRGKVREIQRNMLIMINAIGDMAIANREFSQHQLPSLVRKLLLELFVFPVKITHPRHDVSPEEHRPFHP